MALDPTVCWSCFREECNGSCHREEKKPVGDPENTVRNLVVSVVAMLLAAMLVLLLCAGGCASVPDVQKVASSQSAVTALKIAACVQGALAEEQLEALRQRREQEAAAQIEADRLRSEMHAPSSVSQEVDAIVRPDAGVM